VAPRAVNHQNAAAVLTSILGPRSAALDRAREQYFAGVDALPAEVKQRLGQTEPSRHAFRK
jgi:hypothetical protein